jgi:hypothetical protein
LSPSGKVCKGKSKPRPRNGLDLKSIDQRLRLCQPSYLVPRSSSPPRRRASFLRSFGNGPLERLDQLGDGGEDRAVIGGERSVTILQPAFDSFLRALVSLLRSWTFGRCAFSQSACRSQRLALPKGPALGVGAAMKEGRRCSISGPLRSERAYFLMPATESNLRSTPATPAATLRPVVPSMLSGCSEIDPSIPPTSTLPPSPSPTVALAVTPP